MNSPPTWLTPRRGAGITPESSWFYVRSAKPLGHVRLMLDLPRRDFGPLDCARGFRSGLVVLREILIGACGSRRQGTGAHHDKLSFEHRNRAGFSVIDPFF
jgi:hypothetical protein